MWGGAQTLSTNWGWNLDVTFLLLSFYLSLFSSLSTCLPVCLSAQWLESIEVTKSALQQKMLDIESEKVKVHDRQQSPVFRVVAVSLMNMWPPPGFYSRFCLIVASYLCVKVNSGSLQCGTRGSDLQYLPTITSHNHDIKGVIITGPNHINHSLLCHTILFKSTHGQQLYRHLTEIQIKYLLLQITS